MNVQEIVTAIRMLSEKEREEVFNHFCRSCHDPLDPNKPDWTCLNYCYQCSPDCDD